VYQREISLSLKANSIVVGGYAIDSRDIERPARPELIDKYAAKAILVHRDMVEGALGRGSP
jgi:hypothetical protein